MFAGHQHTEDHHLRHHRVGVSLQPRHGLTYHCGHRYRCSNTACSCRAAKPVDVASCSAEQKRVLYDTSKTSFSSRSTVSDAYYNLIKSYLGKSLFHPSNSAFQHLLCSNILFSSLLWYCRRSASVRYSGPVHTKCQHGHRHLTEPGFQRACCEHSSSIFNNSKGFFWMYSYLVALCQSQLFKKSVFPNAQGGVSIQYLHNSNSFYFHIEVKKPSKNIHVEEVAIM